MTVLDFHQPPPRISRLEEAQALIDQLWGVVSEQRGQIEQLHACIEQLEEQLRLNSGDSSKPPSSDDAKARAERRKRSRSGRKRGAQPGHPDGPPRGQARVLVDEVDRIEEYYPDSRCLCGEELALEAEPAVRHQVFDLPEVRYTVTEYRQYAGRCERCGQRHCARLPDWVPTGQMGPGLIGEIALLNGAYRMSLRQLQDYLRSRWGLDFSLGALSESQGRLTMRAVLVRCVRWPATEEVGHHGDADFFDGDSAHFRFHGTQHAVIFGFGLTASRIRTRCWKIRASLSRGTRGHRSARYAGSQGVGEKMGNCRCFRGWRERLEASRDANG